MSGCKVLFSMAMVSIAVALCPLTTLGARGEQSDSWSGQESSPADELALAQQPPAPQPPAPQPPAPQPIAPQPPTVAAPLVRPPTPAGQRPAGPPPRPRSRFRTASLLASRGPLVRLASMPNMFGDSLGLGTQIWLLDYELYPLPQTFDPAYGTLVEVPGGGRRVKIAENNKALPMDRVYFMYNHFDNAAESYGLEVPGRTFSIDRYTLGVEKTFCDGLWSAEVRLPLGGGYGLTATDFSVEGGDVGNLAIIVKLLLHSSADGALGAGLGIDVPTAGDVAGVTPYSDYVFYNDAVHLSPWIGFLRAPGERLFYQGFVQVDVAANGNRAEFDGTRLGTVSDQTLLLADLEAGYWLYRNPRARCLNGLASILELHYTTTLEDADRISGGDGAQAMIFTNTANRVDLLNLTVGLHAELGLTTLSIGGVFPLREDSDRTFDAELQVFLNRRF